jgi:hypothetical protein
MPIIPTDSAPVPMTSPHALARPHPLTLSGTPELTGSFGADQLASPAANTWEE